jgi:outer membrane protein assembly factor BamB
VTRGVLLGLLVVLLLAVPSAASAATTLVGTETALPTTDSNAAGVAEAFRTTAVASGTLSNLRVYVDGTSTATKLVAGVYADASGHPGGLLAQGTLASPAPGAWNDVPLSGGAIASGSTYWIAVLGSAGTLRFRDRTSGTGRAETSAQTTLTALPSTWTTGKGYNDGPLSAYGQSGTAPPAPVLSVSPSTLAFSATAGGSSPGSQSLSVAEAAGGGLSFAASTDASWLSVAPGSGTTPATLQVSATTGSLAVGTYTGHVTVTASGASGSPAVTTVTFSVENPAPPQVAGDWLQWGHDAERTGFAADETVLDPAAARRLALAWEQGLDGKITAAPLFASGLTVNGATHDVVVVATDNNSLYALDAGTGATLWRRTFGPVATNCAIPGGFGIAGSPLIDRGRARVYTISEDGNLQTVALADGSLVSSLALIDRPATNHVWGGITRLGDRIYAATASDGCDSPPWRGRILTADLSGAAPAAGPTWDVVPGIPAPNGGGGIWGYGGVSVDSATGRIYAATAADSNELFTPFANRMVALDSALNVLGSFRPTDPSQFPCTGAPCDLDFGATPVVFTPAGCPTMVAAGSKDGFLFVFRASTLAAGGQPEQAIQLNPYDDWLGNGGVGGVPAWSPQQRMLYVTDEGPGFGGVSAGVVGLSVDASCHVAPAWSQPLGASPSPNSTPTVADGVVYAGEGSSGRVYAFDAARGTPLWNSGTAAGNEYAAPIVANGTVYSVTWAGTVRAYRPTALPPPGATVLLGDQAIEPKPDGESTGRAEAFQATGAIAGTLSQVSLYLDASSTATKVTVGVYSDAGGHPGALLGQGSTTSPHSGAWNAIPVSGGAVRAGTPYWIAVLGPQSGSLRFRDRSGGCSSEESAQTTLTALPATWSTGPRWSDCPLSAYGTG